MASGKSGVRRVGMGAGVYGFIGRWVPASLVGWMMGMRAVGAQDGTPRMFKRLIENGQSSGSGSASEVEDTSDHGLGGSDYVYPQDEWKEEQ